MTTSLPLGTAYRVEIAPGGKAMVLRFAIDGRAFGETGVTARTSAELRALADAVDRARGRMAV